MMLKTSLRHEVGKGGGLQKEVPLNSPEVAVSGFKKDRKRYILNAFC